MPMNMQEMVLNGFRKEDNGNDLTDKNSSPFTTVKPKEKKDEQYWTLSHGAFQEVFEHKDLEPYGHFTLKTSTNKISAIDTASSNEFLIDPVAFAYDFGARMYDARLGIFTSVDPKANKLPSWSPYAAFANNPIYFVDVYGQVFVTYIKVKNETTGKTEMKKVTFDGVKTTMQTTEKGKLVGDVSEYKAGTNKFVDNIITSYNYIVNNGADVDNAMQSVAKNTTEVQIIESKKNGEYVDGKIEVDFNYGLEVFDDDNSLGVQSAALGFWSEAYHAYINIVDMEAKKQYSNEKAQEEYVHLKKEPEVIDKLKQKDPKNKEAKRKTYKMEGGDAWPVKTKNATSTKKPE